MPAEHWTFKGQTAQRAIGLAHIPVQPVPAAAPARRAPVLIVDDDPAVLITDFHLSNGEVGTDVVAAVRHVVGRPLNETGDPKHRCWLGNYQPGGLPVAQGTPHGSHDQAASA
jgi:hypothetical protein